MSVNFEKIKKLNQVLSLIDKDQNIILSSINNVTKLLVLKTLSEKTNKKFIMVVSNEQRSIKYSHDLEKLGIKTSYFPTNDICLYETNLPKNLYKYKDQLDILQNKPDFILMNVKSLLEKFPDNKFFDENKIELKLGDVIEPKQIAQQLVNIGYRRTTTVNDIGEFSVRGDILDLYSPGEYPLRIEFWGDNIEDLRLFNASNQRSEQHIKSYSVLPIYKYIKNDENLEYDSYFEGNFSKNLKSIIELLENDYIFIFEESGEIFSKYKNLDENYIKKYKINCEKNENLKLKSLNHITYSDFISKLKNVRQIYLDNFMYQSANFKMIEFDGSLITSLGSNPEDIANFIENKQSKGYGIIIATDYKKRVQEILDDYEIKIEKIKFYSNLSLGGGISETLNIALLTDSELFNKKAKDVVGKKYLYKKEDIDFITSVNDIQTGDIVVHQIHGIGKYLGLTKQEIDGEYKDYLTIEYANKDKLHIPCEQINLLSRYRGARLNEVKLSKMGGNDWKNIKTKTKKAMEDIAKELIHLYASRKISEGIKFDEDTKWQLEMEQSFPYTETQDQMKAIIETKKDMETNKPMDRLICADVGFGKTEIAIRSAFKAVMSGKQCAIVVPTTILALQHYETFTQRFKPYPIKIELLTRFKTKKEQKEIIEKLENQQLDIVIGTHRLLQNDIKFKALGLLVIDEEHRFGVKHKEKLKALKKNIDILTMSATPIPRTLYMSLSGIKDMSLINTPPQNRLPIKTYVGENSDEIIKNAIDYEIQREGQVFILYNRVETIYQFKERIQNLVPYAKINVAHGQMDERNLEKVMMDFEEGTFNVLICTTIIESGLNIENANTIIIMDANRFGLAQLYQLRGRVGRSDRQAYCYCLYKKNECLTEEASKRLKAIKDFTTLGSGYQVAMRDIEIRGVGNILGTKQHGHMVNVGFDTYCELLEEAIRENSGEKIEEKEEPTIIDINITAFIPEDWVGSHNQKMIEYKRLSNIETQSDLDILVSEWKDRFSKLPVEVENLIKLIHLRILAQKNSVTMIRETNDNIRIYSKFNKAQWNIIFSKLDINVKKKLKFTVPPKSVENVNSIILLDIRYMNFDEIFNILGNLFYHISYVCSNYRHAKG